VLCAKLPHPEEEDGMAFSELERKRHERDIAKFMEALVHVVDRDEAGYFG
jgi:hypothetical protein